MPVVMFSSLTREGTARCYDALKNGAVDFLCKDFIFQQEKKDIHRKLVIDKVRKAAGVLIKSREPVFTTGDSSVSSQVKDHRLVFCEECGNKEFVAFKDSRSAESVVCSNCGEMIEFAATLHYRRSTFITVAGGNCYLASGHDYMSIEPHGTRLTLHRLHTG